ARCGRHPHILLTVHESPQPQLEVDQRPKSLRVLDPARDVLADQTSNHLTVEDAPPARPLTENQLRHDAAPPTAKPRPHRNGKPHLGTSEDARGQDAFHAVSQYSFRCGPLKLQGSRETGVEFEEVVCATLYSDCDGGHTTMEIVQM